MFAAGDIVQPRLGGPKLKVIEVHGDLGIEVDDALEISESIEV
ncbi:hypothetical protein [Cronobacter malonaticus]|nr:hypothetical protein [Cronobacter malonaticus]